MTKSVKQIASEIVSEVTESGHHTYDDSYAYVEYEVHIEKERCEVSGFTDTKIEHFCVNSAVFYDEIRDESRDFTGRLQEAIYQLIV